MMMASHQTFSGQLWHLTDQAKFDQTNLLYIINGEINKFTIGKQMSGHFSTLIISTERGHHVYLGKANSWTPFASERWS